MSLIGLCTQAACRPLYVRIIYNYYNLPENGNNFRDTCETIFEMMNWVLILLNQKTMLYLHIHGMTVFTGIFSAENYVLCSHFFCNCQLKQRYFFWSIVTLFKLCHKGPFLLDATQYMNSKVCNFFLSWEVSMAYIIKPCTFFCSEFVLEGWADDTCPERSRYSSCSIWQPWIW